MKLFGYKGRFEEEFGLAVSVLWEAELALQMGLWR